MMRLSLKSKFLFSLLCCAWICTSTAYAQSEEQLYATGELNLELKSGGETQYFAVCLKNASQDYVAYQVDIVLPPGLQLATYEGEPDIYIENTALYPTTRQGATYHSLAIDVNSNRIRVICADINGNRALKARSGELFLVGVTTSPYLKPEDVTVELKNVVMSNIEATGPVYETMGLHKVGTAGSTATLTLKVSASNRFSTAILPFGVNEMPAGLEAYSCAEMNGEYLVLQKQDAMQAFTPYILYAANGYEGVLTGEVEASNYQTSATSGYLNGSIVRTELCGDEGNYVLQNQGEGPMFYKVANESFSIPAGKCWLTLPQGAQNVAVFRLPNATAIKSTPSSESKACDVYFNLSGRQVEEPVKGVYIHKGKKLIK